MSQKSIVRINYNTPEHATEMAAMLERSCDESGIRVIQDGSSIALYPDSPMLLGLMNYVTKVYLRIRQFVKRSQDTGGTAVEA